MSKTEKDKQDIKKNEEDEMNEGGDGKSDPKSKSRSSNRNRDDRRRTKEQPVEDKPVKSREGKIENAFKVFLFKEKSNLS